VGGFPVEAQVASIRTLDWSSFHPNFYMIFNQPLAASEGALYLVSFHLPVDQKVNLNALIRSIPTAAVLEVDGIIEQVQDIVRQVTTAIEFMLVMILISGLLVLLAGIQSSLDQRFREGALMRTLGARKAMLRQALWIEFGALGATAGLLGAAATEVILFYLQTQLFDLPAQWHPLLWLLAPILGAVFIGAVGVLATRSVLRVPPLQILRHWLA
jgi:putative ABC transport system permease protein